MPRLRVVLELVQDPARQIVLVPAGLNYDARRARLLARQPGRIPPVPVFVPDDAACRLFRVLYRVVDDAVMESLAGGRTADTGCPEPASGSSLPVFDCAGVLLHGAAGRTVVVARVPAERVGQLGGVAADRDPLLRLRVQQVGREHAGNKFRFPVARRHEDHEVQDLAVGHALQRVDQVDDVIVEHVSRVYPLDESTKRKNSRRGVGNNGGRIWVKFVRQSVKQRVQQCRPRWPVMRQRL